MASKSTGWKCTHTASVVSETNTTATIRVTGYWENLGWSYDINYVSAWVYCNGSSYQIKNNGSVDAPSSYTKYSMGYHDFTINKTTAKQSISCYAKITSNSSYVSGTKSSSAASISVSAKPSYTVTYNANSGTGAPASQTKWYGTNLTLSTAKPARTGYTFSKWNTNSSGTGTSYNPGASYTSNANLTLYAIWTANTFTVSYNANGGTGAPANQTKTYGTNLTLSSTKPTRENYNFLGWSTSANGGVVYSAGDTYTNNSAVTLYAVWELAYVEPRINNFTVQRCDSSGAMTEDGTYVKVSFDWATDKDVIDIVIEWKTQTSDSWTSAVVTASGTSGSVEEVVGSDAISTETSYIFRAYVKDMETDGTTYSPLLPVGSIKFPIDVKAEGKGVSFGKAAELENVADFAFTVKLGGGLTPIFLEAETDLDDVKTPNFYTGENISHYNYTNCPLQSGTFYLEVVSMGSEGQVRQTITSCSKTDAITYQRFYYQETWGEWIHIQSLSTPIIPANTDLNTITNIGLYVGGSQTAYKYVNIPSLVTEGTFSLELISMGTAGQLKQLLVTTHKTESQIFERFYYEDSWGAWINYADKFKDIVTVIGNGDTTLTTTNATELPMKGSVVIGHRLTNNSSGQVVIGPGVKYVKIEGSIYAYSGFSSGDLVHLNICKTDTNGNKSTVYAQMKRITGSYETVTGPAKIISVSEGDIISLSGRNQSSARGVISGNGNCTYMTVEAVG